METKEPSDESKVISLNWSQPIEDIVNLNSYKNLRYLTWRNLSNEAIVVLLTSYVNPVLTHLDISRDHCFESQLLILKKPLRSDHLFVSKNLTFLNIAGVFRMTNWLLKDIVEAHPNIEQLDLSCNTVRDIASLRHLKLLSELNLSNNYLDDGDARQINQQFDSVTQLNLNHNELSDAGIRSIFLNIVDVPFRYAFLDISNQKRHFIRKETIADVQQLIAKLREKQAEPHVEPAVIQERKSLKLEVKYQNDLITIFNTFPNLNRLEIVFVNDRALDFKEIPKFERLQSLEIVNWTTANKHPRLIFKNKTCTKYTFSSQEQITQEVDFAKHIVRARQIKELEFRLCRIGLNFFSKLISSRSVSHLYFEQCVFAQVPTEERRKSLFDKLLKNENLTFIYLDIDIRFEDNVRPFLNEAEKLQLIEHRRKNESNLRAMQQVVPLLKATQMGGPLRHSTIPLVPIINGFLGIEPPKQEQIMQISKKIEPERPEEGMLPLMFT